MSLLPVILMTLICVIEAAAIILIGIGCVTGFRQTMVSFNQLTIARAVEVLMVVGLALLSDHEHRFLLMALVVPCVFLQVIRAWLAERTNRYTEFDLPIAVVVAVVATTLYGFMLTNSTVFI